MREEKLFLRNYIIPSHYVVDKSSIPHNVIVLGLSGATKGPETQKEN